MARNREDWLQALAHAVEPLFSAAGFQLGPYRMAIGFPSTGKRGSRIGECWDVGASGDGTHEILIRPDQDDPMAVAAVAIHELCHIAVGLAAGHGPKFGACARAIGLTGKMTATTLTPGLRDTLRPIVEALGTLPHARLTLGQSSGPKKQTTRLLKAVCSECGYTVRVTRKWAEVGAPLCPTHGPMDIEWPDEGPEGDEVGPWEGIEPGHQIDLEEAIQRARRPRRKRRKE